MLATAPGRFPHRPAPALASASTLALAPDRPRPCSPCTPQTRTMPPTQLCSCPLGTNLLPPLTHPRTPTGTHTEIPRDSGRGIATGVVVVSGRAREGASAAAGPAGSRRGAAPFCSAQAGGQQRSSCPRAAGQPSVLPQGPATADMELTGPLLGLLTFPTTIAKGTLSRCSPLLCHHRDSSARLVIQNLTQKRTTGRGFTFCYFVKLIYAIKNRILQLQNFTELSKCSC